MTGPKCIVCGKPIKKKTETVYFKLADAEHPHGTVEREYQWSSKLYLDVIPKTKTEAQRYVNQPIVHVSRSHRDEIYSVSIWDGESYDDPFFHSGDCAKKQGYAAARAGHRWTWRQAE